MSLIDSEASLTQRCDELDTKGDLKTALHAKQLRTYRQLAFAVGTPQQPPDDAKMQAFAEQIFTAGPTLLQLSMLRTVLFEANTLIVAALREQVNQDPARGSQAVKELPNAERLSRLAKQKARLSGVDINGELQPSNYLCDLANTIYETSIMQWVAPSKCSKRDAEVQHNMKSDAKNVLHLEKDSLVLAPKSHAQADVSNELRLQWALQRRGVAFDQCLLVSWAVHQSWVTLLLEAMSEEPPPGYSRVSAAQVVRADKELWTLVSKASTGSFKVDSAGRSPCDRLVTDHMRHPKIAQMLLPLPKGLATAVAQGTSVKATELDGEAPKKPPKKTKKNARKRPAGAKPAALAAFACKTKDNKPVCWAFNTAEGCSEEVTDGRCKKGYHVCCKCLRANHSLVTCRVAKKE